MFFCDYLHWRFHLRLVLPEPEVKLYETGFEGEDLLNRKSFSAKLSELVEKIEDPCVIALDGTWGSGKSYFLKRWVGAHAKENGGQALTVYFDAFQHDFLEDPLTALVGVISDRFETEPNQKQDVWKVGKTLAAKLWRPAIRVAAAVATSGVSEMTGSLGDALFAGTQSEIDKASETFWKREDGKRAAIAEFRAFLVSLTTSQDGETKKRVVVVVDELDRCRPDYALALLETIKHFFSVPNIHFVLGVNLAELENIVKSRYGIQTAARDYVKKFITIRVQLPNSKLTHKSQQFWQVFFERSARMMKLDSMTYQEVSRQLGRIQSEEISLRTVERLLSEIAILPKFQISGMAWAYQKLICGLMLLGFFRPDLIRSAKLGTLTLADVTSLFRLQTKQRSTSEEDLDSYRAYLLWCYVLQAPEMEKIEKSETDKIQAAFSNFGEFPNIPQLINEYLEFANLDYR